jgi:hypothetical protein
VAELGTRRVVQAFELVEFGVVNRATANSSRTAAGHKQDDQAAKTKPPRRELLAISGSESGVTQVAASSSLSRADESPQGAPGFDILRSKLRLWSSNPENTQAGVSSKQESTMRGRLRSLYQTEL